MFNNVFKKKTHTFPPFWRCHFLVLSHDCHLIPTPGSLVLVASGREREANEGRLPRGDGKTSGHVVAMAAAGWRSGFPDVPDAPVCCGVARSLPSEKTGRRVPPRRTSDYNQLEGIRRHNKPEREVRPPLIQEDAGKASSGSSGRMPKYGNKWMSSSPPGASPCLLEVAWRRRRPSGEAFA